MTGPRWVDDIRDLALDRYNDRDAVLAELIAYLTETRQGTRYCTWLRRRVRAEVAQRGARLVLRVRGTR